MKVREIILLITGLLGGLRGVTRLHKLIFLAREEGDLSINVEFIPYLYGPWSPDVHEEVKKLVKEGLIRVSTENQGIYSESPPKIYTLTKYGEEELRRILANISDEEFLKIRVIINRYGFMPLTYLLAYIYSRYPEYTKSSTIIDRVREWRKYYGLRLIRKR